MLVKSKTENLHETDGVENLTSSYMYSRFKEHKTDP